VPVLKLDDTKEIKSNSALKLALLHLLWSSYTLVASPTRIYSLPAYTCAKFWSVA
jgi:hypothetical protein